jgi:hypothetical protein
MTARVFSIPGNAPYDCRVMRWMHGRWHDHRCPRPSELQVCCWQARTGGVDNVGPRPQSRFEPVSFARAAEEMVRPKLTTMKFAVSRCFMHGFVDLAPLSPSCCR